MCRWVYHPIRRADWDLNFGLTVGVKEGFLFPTELGPSGTKHRVEAAALAAWGEGLEGNWAEILEGELRDEEEKAGPEDCVWALNPAYALVFSFTEARLFPPQEAHLNYVVCFSKTRITNSDTESEKILQDLCWKEGRNPSKKTVERKRKHKRDLTPGTILWKIKRVDFPFFFFFA